MELRELYALPALKAELQHELRKRAELEEQSNSIGPTMNGMPRPTTVSSKVETYAILIHDTDIRIENILNRVYKIEDYIESVEDDMVRAIMKLKFMDCYTYAMIARSIGGRNTKESIKKMLDRYLRGEKE